MEFHWVTPRIAFGSQIKDEGEVEWLVHQGITDILDANDDVNDAALLANSILVYCWNPTADDGKLKPLWYWESTLRFSLPMFAQGNRKIYFHCEKGHNRGPSNAALTMMALGWTRNQSLALIRAANPEATTRYIDQAAEAIVQLGYR